MGTLQAYNFLIKAAGMQERRKELFSRAEISKRINEIKYLSSQKKIPKLSLRKEIVNLEQQLHKLTKLEEDLAKDKRKESARVSFLKRQNQLLKQRLAATADKEMGHKVEKISYLLSECLAKQQTSDDIEFTKHLLKAAKKIGLEGFKEKAEKIYVEYKQHLVSGLRFVTDSEKITGNNYTIINAKNNIKDTIIGTLASILSFSSIYKEGTIIIAMAYNEDKIKISARISGKSGNNKSLKELMNYITACLGGESGGHKEAAGCTIKKDDENKFIELVQKKFEYETIKI